MAHDASGPVAIDLALDRQDRVGALLLLNTYYGNAPSLRIPEMIRLLADPNFASLADAIMADPNQRLWLLGYTALRFGDNPNDPNGVGVNAVLPQFFGDSGGPDALTAIRSWTADLFGALAAMNKSASSWSSERTPMFSRRSHGSQRRWGMSERCAFDLHFRRAGRI